MEWRSALLGAALAAVAVAGAISLGTPDRSALPRDATADEKLAEIPPWGPLESAYPAPLRAPARRLVMTEGQARYWLDQDRADRLEQELDQQRMQTGAAMDAAAEAETTAEAAQDAARAEGASG